MKTLIYDIEIAAAVPGKEARVQGVEYCAGWHDQANMGVSVICAYELEAERSRCFFLDNRDAFQQLVDEADLIVGFNSIPFDNSVLRACGWTNVPDEKSYDILREVWAASGLGPKFKYPSHVGFGLDQCALAHFGVGKSGYGGTAPIDFQRGRYGSLVDYCLNDVWLTTCLFRHIVDDGWLTCPKTGTRLTMRKP
jgi:hypothetical protein